MKKILYTFLCLTIIFSSCKKEETTNNSSNNTSIAGTWNATSIYIGPNQLVIPGLTTYTFYINADKSFRQYAYATDGSSQDVYGDWDRSGSILTINYNTGEYLQYTIVSVTNTTANLELNFYIDDSGDTIATSGLTTLERL